MQNVRLYARGLYFYTIHNRLIQFKCISYFWIMLIKNFKNVSIGTSVKLLSPADIQFSGFHERITSGNLHHIL